MPRCPHLRSSMTLLLATWCSLPKLPRPPGRLILVGERSNGEMNN